MPKFTTLFVVQRIHHNQLVKLLLSLFIVTRAYVTRLVSYFVFNKYLPFIYIFICIIIYIYSLNILILVKVIYNNQI